MSSNPIPEKTYDQRLAELEAEKTAAIENGCVTHSKYPIGHLLHEAARMIKVDINV